MYPYIDMHCDSLLRVLKQGADSLYDGKGMQSISKMLKAGQMCQFFAIFFRQEWKQVLGSERQKSVVNLDEKYFLTLRNALYEQVGLHAEKIAMTHNYEEIQANRAMGRASAVLTIEDGRLVDGCMDRLQLLHIQGVRAITLTWNHANCFGYPNSKENEIMRRGLTHFGKEAIEEMNRLGMLIDVSHLSDGGFWDVAFLSVKPFIASHSNCRALTTHPRNLTDDMIVCLAEKGGVAGVNLYPSFVSRESSGGSEPILYSRYIDNLADHVLHFIRVGGEDCVGIGTDFDGMECEVEIDEPCKMERLFHVLQKKGMTSRQLDKFTYGNVLRVIKDTLK